MTSDLTSRLPEHRDILTGTRVPLVVLAIVLLFGAHARLAGLGNADFWEDELLHVLPAQSLDRGAGPRLPSGELYTRGVEMTRLVRVAQHYVSDPETAARLPSAILGIASLVIFAAAAWRMAGPWPAVWATLLLAIFPVSLHESRNARFYTEQLAHGLIALYAGWRALEPHPGSRDGADLATSAASRWGWVVLALGAFALAARVQPTTLSVAAGCATVVAVFGIVDLFRFGRRAIRASLPLQLAIVGSVALAAGLLARPDVARNALAVARFVPLWAINDYSPLAYYWMLSAAAPVMLSLMPLIFLAVARRSWALSVYLLAWFAIPVALHSFVFRFQADRYVILAIPGLLLAAAIAASDGCGVLRRAISDWVERRVTRATPAAARYAGVCGAVLVALAAVITTPAFTRARKVATGQLVLGAQTDWRAARAVLRETPGADTIPLGTLHALPAVFYLGRASFTIQHGWLERRSGGPNTAGPRPIRMHPQGTSDYYVGIPVLSTPDAVTQRFGSGREVIIAIDSTLETSALSITRDFTHGPAAPELCDGRCGTLHLHRWTLRERASHDEQ